MTRRFDLDEEEGLSTSPAPGGAGPGSQGCNGSPGANPMGALGAFIFQRNKNLQQALEISPVTVQRENTPGWEWESLIALLIKGADARRTGCRRAQGSRNPRQPLEATEPPSSPQPHGGRIQPQHQARPRYQSLTPQN